jgi:hypothetical protein
MVHHITNVIKEYQYKLREMPYAPKTCFQRHSPGYCGDANTPFLTFLFSEQSTGIQFLKDVRLIPIKVQCNSCGRDMTWYVEANVPDGFRWRCRRMVGGTRCAGSRSIRHSSWFHKSKLSFQEVLYLTANLPTTSNTNIISVVTRSLTGVCSAEGNAGILGRLL